MPHNCMLTVTSGIIFRLNRKWRNLFDEKKVIINFWTLYKVILIFKDKYWKIAYVFRSVPNDLIFSGRVAKGTREKGENFFLFPFS